MNEFTGERVIPGKVEVDLWNEHVSRYAFAARYARDKRVLDVGCGTGYGAAELSRTATAVVAIDRSEEAIAYASTHYRTGNVQYVLASAAQIPLTSEQFDLITGFELIEHLQDWREFLCEVSRLARPDGLFIVSTPNREYYTESRAERGPNPFHHHEFDVAEFANELRALFPHVCLFLQNHGEALTFHPANGFGPVEGRIESGSGTASAAHFFVALCSRSAQASHSSFVFVPRVANVLRERERHIELLAKQVTEALNQRDQLHQALEAQKTHLEQQNRWAMDIEQQWKTAQKRLTQLQDELQELTSAYQIRVTELEADVVSKTKWALETEARLTAEIEEFKFQSGQLAAQLAQSEATVEERTRWALDLEVRANHLEAQLNLIRSSRWIRLGRQVGLGPAL